MFSSIALRVLSKFSGSFCPEVFFQVKINFSRLLKILVAYLTDNRCNRLLKNREAEKLVGG